MEGWSATERGRRAASAAALVGLLILLSCPRAASPADVHAATVVFYVG